jgi:hypothetical protein
MASRVAKKGLENVRLGTYECNINLYGLQISNNALNTRKAKASKYYIYLYQ